MSIVEKNTAEEMSRRSFLSMGALMAGAAVVAGTTVCTPSEAVASTPEDGEKAPADEASRPAQQIEGVSSLTGWTGTPAEIEALGGSTMPLADLNQYRKEYIDSQTDYTMEDGTVIPAVYTKVRALIHTYGMGCGNTLNDAFAASMLGRFSEDDAQAFLDMPWGQEFTAVDLWAKTGRPLDDCKDICERWADEGYLCRYETTNGTTYHQVPYFQGVVEYHFPQTVRGEYTGIVGLDISTGEKQNDTKDGGTPTFYAVPCDKSVTSGNTILPYDDVIEIIKGKNKLAIAPCFCRYVELIESGVTDCPTFEDFATGEFEGYMSPINNLRVETCLQMGVEAEYWISRGIAREITPEEAVRYMERSRDDGFILQSSFGKESETICSCHGDCCNILNMFKAAGSPEVVGASQGFQQISHYNLEVDFDSCIKCGTCETRCPAHAITMDGEDGAPVVSPVCYRCGQCAFVCPQGARTLVQRPESEILELPKDFLDDNNMKAAYRFEHGLIR